MACERIGLRFSKKDVDIISWMIMLKENNIEQSFAIKSLLKAFFLHENVNAGTVKIRSNASFEATSISINEVGLNDDIMKLKAKGIKIATFTKDIIRSYIIYGTKDIPPTYEELQLIHNKYRIQYLNKYISTTETEEKEEVKLNENVIDEITVDNDINMSNKIKDYKPAEKKSADKKNKKKNPLLSQI